MKKMLIAGVVSLLCMNGSLSAHCQMPCGIYHDDMVYDQVDQYVETMIKGLTTLKYNQFDTVMSRNQFVRWVIEKETASDEVANIITKYFLQQKIKPGEDETDKRLRSAHKLLFLLVAIKQNTDVKMVDEFAAEWERFKLMFHVEGYECQIEVLKQKKREQAEKEAKAAGAEHSHDHDHDHDHDHPHTH